LQNHQYGITSDGSSYNNFILNNNASYNDEYGIYLSQSDNNNTISNNDASRNGNSGIGILYYSNNNTLSINIATYNNNNGIVVICSSESNDISNNNCSKNGHNGMYIQGSSKYNKIWGNNASLNGDSGIVVDDSCHYNTVWENRAIQNGEYGISVKMQSYNCTIYRNTLSNNIYGQGYCEGSNKNMWDNGSQGNYWGDYRARYPSATLISPGFVWSIPYPINGSTLYDNFPLIINRMTTNTHVNSLNYSYGTTGNQISWQLVDDTTYQPKYTIYRNSSLVTGHINQPWQSSVPIQLAVDGLYLGTYNFTMVSNDGLGCVVCGTVIVRVTNTPLSIEDAPTDISFTTGSTGHSVSWTFSDPDVNGPTYVVYLDGAVHTSGTWISDLPVIVNIDSIPVGVHNITIVARDGLGGCVQETVFVTVTSSAPQGGNWWEQPWVWSIIGAVATVTFGLIKLLSDKSKKRKKASKEFKVLDWKRLETIGVAKQEDASIILDLIEREPNSSLNRMRTLMERVIEHLYLQSFPNTRDFARIPLGDRIYRLHAEGIIPTTMQVQLNSIRHITNLGTHGNEATTKDAASTLPMLVNFLEWFIKFEKDIKK